MEQQSFGTMKPMSLHQFSAGIVPLSSSRLEYSIINCIAVTEYKKGDSVTNTYIVCMQKRECMWGTWCQ